MYVLVLYKNDVRSDAALQLSVKKATNCGDRNLVESKSCMMFLSNLLLINKNIMITSLPITSNLQNNKNMGYKH